MPSATDLIKLLDLKPLPIEGGFYKETYRSQDMLPCKKQKSLNTAIYYLLTPETRSALHRLPSDEIYHFYLGDPVKFLLLYENGESEIKFMGPDVQGGQTVQLIVPGLTWQGSMLVEGGRFALMGTTMSPGFDFSDFIPGSKETLVSKYPQQSDLIKKLI